MGLNKNAFSLPVQRMESRYLLIPLSLVLTYLALRATRLEGFYSEHKYAAAFVLSLVGSFVSVLVAWDQLKAPLQFIYSCFLKPIGNHGHNQASRLDTFYEDQAEGKYRWLFLFLSLRFKWNWQNAFGKCTIPMFPWFAF